MLIGYTGLRGEEVAARQVGGWMEAEGIEVRYAPIDEYYVHIDLMVCMLAEKLAAVCLDTTDPDIVTWIEAKGHRDRAGRASARRWASAATWSRWATTACCLRPRRPS